MTPSQTNKKVQYNLGSIILGGIAFILFIVAVANIMHIVPEDWKQMVWTLFFVLGYGSFMAGIVLSIKRVEEK